MDKNPKYYKHVRLDLIQEVSVGSNIILDVGCAEGSTGKVLKSNGQAEVVVGIEIVPIAADLAKSRLDRVICGDLEQIDLENETLHRDFFDYVICGDVLEHLKDPWCQVERLVMLLKPGGSLIASIPNLQYLDVSAQLLFRGDFVYCEAGIMDRTHLRFFTKKSSEQLLVGAGLTISKVIGVKARRRDKILSFLTLGFFDGLFSTQYIVVGMK